MDGSYLLRELGAFAVELGQIHARRDFLQVREQNRIAYLVLPLQSWCGHQCGFEFALLNLREQVRAEYFWELARKMRGEEYGAMRWKRRRDSGEFTTVAALANRELCSRNARRWAIRAAIHLLTPREDQFIFAVDLFQVKAKRQIKQVGIMHSVEGFNSSL